MVGRRPLIAIAASALLLVGGQSAAFAADDDGVPFQQLVQVYVPDEAAVDSVVANYDAAEYRSVQDDGSILLNVFVTAEEKAALKAKGYEIGRVIEDSNTGAQRMKERQEIIDQEAVAADVAENGLRGARFEGRSVAAVPGQGDTVIQRADVFTDAVGPTVEPHDRALPLRRGVQQVHEARRGLQHGLHRPGAGAVLRRPRRRLLDAGQHGSLHRQHDSTPDEYMYHRQLVRLTGAYANLAADDIQLRVATAATAGGAEASVETFPVTEWLGTDLPPHVAGFRTEFFTHYQDPTETRADLDALAAAYPELMSVVNMPELTSGYQRKSQAIMNGTTGIGSTPAAALGPLLVNTTGEITAAQPVASIPFTGEAGQCSTARSSTGSRAARPTSSSPSRTPPATSCRSIDTGTSPETITQVFPTSRHLHATRSRASRATSATSRSRSRRSSHSAVVLTTKDWGHEGGNQVRPSSATRARPNQPLSVAVTGKLIEVVLGTDGTGALSSTAAQVVAAINASPAAAALVMATTYRGNAGAGIVQPRARTNLSDFLNAPASVARGPFQQHLYRIGAHRDGSKVGVFLFCQQHAREWTTSLTCQETAHQLVENYATDPQTKQLLDNVEVFISPNNNPDGAHYSMYDSSVQRKTMPNYCPVTGNSDPAARNDVGRRHEPQHGRVHAVRRLLRRLDLVHERDLRRPGRVLRAGESQREVGRGHVPEHQVHEQHPLLRWVLHVGAGLLQERRVPHHGAGAEHRHREVLLRGR